MVCKADKASYSSLANRWKDNNQLRLWWSAMSEVEQITWYRKQQERGYGSHRQCDMGVVYVESDSANLGHARQQ